MARRRAVSPADKSTSPEKLPLLYRTMVPLSAERQGALRLRSKRDFQVAAAVNAIPLTVDEFPRAMQDYPIVIASGSTPMPVALVGFQKGKNDFVSADGTWRDGAYVPAYLRRFPFALLKESPDADRHILCGDLSSTVFTEDAAVSEPLFEDGKPAAAIDRALDFCRRYAAAVERTKALMEEVNKLDLVGPSAVTISRGDAKRKVEGFSIVSEEKLRDLDDKTLAGLARRGVLNLFAAHQMSLANFSSFGEA
ncbi:MAG: SapC family protein [Pseudomonadota bacterium]